MSRAVFFDMYDTLAWIDWAAIDSGRAELARRAGIETSRLLERLRDTLRLRSLGQLGTPEPVLEADTSSNQRIKKRLTSRNR